MPRRGFIKLIVEGAAALGFFKVASLIPSRLQTSLVRPPGAVEEELFNALCIRCGICLEVCPTKAIVLAGYEDGIEAADTPKIEPTIGPCEFYRGRCDREMKCSKFCPTGALQQVNKEQVKAGTVEFYPDKCLAHMEKECLVCGEMCPVREAITVDSQFRPIFHGEKCVGCGICVHQCPAEPKALTLRPTGAKRANA
ncbi:MAG: 4Fe-4S dicluster domain-containing protein [Candidatus Bathyarchaeota archaeon]|nr:4Fe-4S dicluster domain-containing protein [Candidatus Bathyarchaeota archaeon]